MLRDHTSQKPHPDPTALWRQATERYGLSTSSTICQNIKQLQRHWSDPLFACVERAFANLDAARNAMPRISDRIAAPDVFAGELLIGLVMMLTGNLAPVLISPSRLTLHTIISGLPGRGKTFLCGLLLNMLQNISPHVKVCLFDPNRSYAAICADPDFWLTVPWDSLKLGLFAPPPGYPLARWLSENIDLLARGELLHSRYLLMRLLKKLASEMRAAAGGAPTIPSLLDLCDALGSMKCRPWTPEERYRQSALNVLGGRIDSTGNVFDCSIGMESMLTDTRIRISTEGLSPLESLDFLVTHLIHYVCRRRETEPLSDPVALHTIFVIEEAANILQARGENIAFYQELLLRARSLGIGFIFITQDISKIEPIVLAACSNHFVFGQASSEDKRTCQNILDLSSRETHMLGELSVGECFIRLLGHETFPWPFLARIPDARSF